MEIIKPKKVLADTSYLLIVHCTIKSSAEYGVEQCSMFQHEIIENLQAQCTVVSNMVQSCGQLVRSMFSQLKFSLHTILYFKPVYLKVTKTREVFLL